MVVYPTARAQRLLDLPRRKIPRVGTADHLHTVRVGTLLAATEVEHQNAPTDVLALSERDLHQAHSQESPACAYVYHPGGRKEKRWPDLAVRRADGSLEAHEVELTPKWTPRLEAIIRGYAVSPWFRHVFYYVEAPTLGARIARCAAREHSPITVVPWTGDTLQDEAIMEAVEVAKAEMNGRATHPL